jgi:LysM repeat protein
MQPGDEITWLMEVQEDGVFIGYMRITGVFDPSTNRIVFTVPGSMLQGTLFLPVVLTEAYMRNFDPNVRLWSSPFKDAVDFGVVGPQWTRLRVLSPQVGQRIMVYNTFTKDIGWVDQYGVGPTAKDDGMPDFTLPGTAPSPAVSVTPTPIVTPTPAPVSTAERTYTVRQGDTLQSIAREQGTTVVAILQANPLIVDPDAIQLGTLIRLAGTAPSAPVAAPPVIPASLTSGETYTVRPGETLQVIARSFGTTLAAILRANPNLTDADNVQAGTVIRLP